MAPRVQVVLFASVLLTGCGKRGDPRPPLRRTPAPVTEFRLAQRGDKLEVSGTAPRASLDGVRLERVTVEFLYAWGEADLERAGERRAVAAEGGQRVTSSLPLPTPGTLVRAAARAVAGGDAGSRTLTRTLVAQPPPEPPRELRAELREDGVSLMWRGPRPTPAPPPPRPEAAGGGAPHRPQAIAAPREEPPAAKVEAARAGFFVYRRRSDSAYGAPLFAEPQEGRSYVDGGAAPGQRLCYVVRAVASVDPLIESAASEEACVDVHDVAAPATPTGLTALGGESGIELAWSPSPEPDLAGYRLFRSTSPGIPELLTELTPAQTVHLDPAPEPGVVYRYALTAFDSAGNESPPSPAVEASRP